MTTDSTAPDPRQLLEQIRERNTHPCGYTPDPSTEPELFNHWVELQHELLDRARTDLQILADVLTEVLELADTIKSAADVYAFAVREAHRRDAFSLRRTITYELASRRSTD